jgi:hypothetical protein
LKTPSKGFLTSLEILDSLLSVRWGEVIGQWVIQREARIPDTEMEFLKNRRERLRRFVNGFGTDRESEQYRRTWNAYVGVCEEYTSATASKRVILFTPELTPKVYDMLCASDIRRYGGYSRYADELEAKEIAAQNDKERIWENERKALHAEVYDQLNFIWRNKETELLDGQRNMQKLLHGRIKDSDEPLIKTSF